MCTVAASALALERVFASSSEIRGCVRTYVLQRPSSSLEQQPGAHSLCTTMQQSSKPGSNRVSKQIVQDNQRGEAEAAVIEAAATEAKKTAVESASLVALLTQRGWVQWVAKICIKYRQHGCSSFLQINEYQTVPYFIPFSKNLTFDCLLISVFSPNLSELNLKLFCSDIQNNFRLSSGKFWGKHRNQQTNNHMSSFG